MKYIVLILLLTVSQAKAEHEVSFGYMKMSQDLFSTIEFDIDGAMLGYAYWHGSFGFKVQAGKGVESPNALYVKDTFYKADIQSLFSGTIMYRQRITNKWNIEAGVGKTDYKSAWTINNEPAPWGVGSDSDWSYHVGITYKTDTNWKVGLEYVDAYRKNKEGYGKETTNYFNLNIRYIL